MSLDLNCLTCRNDCLEIHENQVNKSQGDRGIGNQD